jgi:hypothetical protein
MNRTRQRGAAGYETALQQSRLREREDSLRDNQVVEDLHVDEGESGRQSACDRFVGGTGLGDARRVVVPLMCPAQLRGQ